MRRPSGDHADWASSARTSVSCACGRPNDGIAKMSPLNAVPKRLELDDSHPFSPGHDAWADAGAIAAATPTTTSDRAAATPPRGGTNGHGSPLPRERRVLPGTGSAAFGSAVLCRRPRAALLERREPRPRVVLPLGVALVEQIVRAAPRPARRQQVVGQVGVEERELAPLVDELGLRAEDGLGAGRAHPAEARGEHAVGVGDRVEVPRRGDDARRVAERAERAVEADELGAGAVAADSGELALALGVRRDPQPAAERPEAGPRQPRAHLVADLAALLGHAQDDEQPAMVPRPRLAE